jgi:hypothetical protein
MDNAVPGGRRAALTGLARTAADQLQRTVSLVYAELLRRAVAVTTGGDPPYPPATASRVSSGELSNVRAEGSPMMRSVEAARLD